MKNLKVFFVMSLVLIASCSGEATDTSNGQNQDSSDNGDNGGGISGDWLIPVNEVRDGGPGKDGIPSIDDPNFSSIDDLDSQINDEDIVVVMKLNEEIKVYPHFILDYHEVVNDQFGSENITLSYCPLTGTSFAWQSEVEGSFSTYGVSGLLYNSNLILYDRETDSNWSQILELCVNGETIGSEPVKRNLIESDWGSVKSMFPEAAVLNTNTGFDRPYGTYPYGVYLDVDDFFLFTPSIVNPQLPNKLRVLTIRQEDNAKVYQFSSFENGRAIKDEFGSEEYLIVGNETVLNAFRLTGNETTLNFTYNFNGTESFFTDNEGNTWNLFGEAISGPRTGSMLDSADTFVSMWFAVAAFFPDPIIFE